MPSQRAVSASQRKSGAGKANEIKGLRRVRPLTWSRDPPRGWPGGGQDDFDTLTGRQSEIFGGTAKILRAESQTSFRSQGRQNFLLKNFCIVSNIYPHVCSSCIVKFDYVIANLLTSAML
jgi:hypothetical protein